MLLPWHLKPDTSLSQPKPALAFLEDVGGSAGADACHTEGADLEQLVEIAHAARSLHLNVCR